MTPVPFVAGGGQSTVVEELGACFLYRVTLWSEYGAHLAASVTVRVGSVVVIHKLEVRADPVSIYLGAPIKGAEGDVTVTVSTPFAVCGLIYLSC